jgi:predicted NBD/HSP70 family sugar kinase
MARAAARPDEIRRHNLGLLLEQVHRDGELTRAELTQRLGLNRSTIGVLVAGLSELGVVSESVPKANDRAGRPSHVVGPSLDGPYAVAVDLDVDHIVIAAIGLGGRVIVRHESVVDEQHRTPEMVAALIAEKVHALTTEVATGWPTGVGVSIPGTVARGGVRVDKSPNLAWVDVPFADLLYDRLIDPLPVRIGNDADLGVLAEHLRGAARDCGDVVYLTGRIGVGAGILVEGAPLRGHSGLAGEIGHVMLDPNGPLCHCGNRGCAETYIGQLAVLEASGRELPPGRDSASLLASAVEQGDPAVVAALRKCADPLGRTIAALVNVLDPDRVVLGGILAEILAVAEDEVTEAVNRHGFGTNRGAAILCAAGLGQDSSLVGAAELAFQQLLADPLSRR